MASTTYNHRKGSTFRAAMQRSAENRQCPECGRKSALSHYSDEMCFGSVCRWCGFKRLHVRNDVLLDGTGRLPLNRQARTGVDSQPPTRPQGDTSRRKEDATP